MKYQPKDLPPGGDVGGSDLPDRGVSSGIVFGKTQKVHRKGYSDESMSDMVSADEYQRGPRFPGEVR